MHQDLLQGAARVLEQDGAARFNTNRVAEVTGVSVGSVYQFFPNKESLLVELHDAEGARLWSILETMLGDTSLPPRTRFVNVVGAFFQTQVAAAEHHRALRNARVAPEESDAFAQLLATVESALAAFLRETVPTRASESEFLAKFTLNVILGTGRTLSESEVTEGELAQLTRATTDMLALYLGL
jgi:AcrR family transcriptional regulator